VDRNYEKGGGILKGLLHYVDPIIIRALNKSELRRKVIFYLDSIYPNYAYLSVIARDINSDPSNVLGCLRGLGNRYNGNSSLIELGLVEVTERGGNKYYKLTEYGKEVVGYTKEYYRIY